jgi:alpha-beta hydrolase superfamily lysophospholipase
MHPFYFGRAERPLFGLYHPAATGPGTRGVVLVHPLGPEYVPAYPALQQLALRLSRAGVHVLRFDLYGAGDSGGELGEGALSDWQDDLQLAAEELRAMANVRQVTLVGLRLGATLAVLAQRAGLHADRLALWAPVLHGAGYLAELRALEDAYTRHALPAPREAVARGPRFEVLGCPISEALEDELSALDLRSGPALDVPTFVLARPGTEGEVFRYELSFQVELAPYEEAPIWLKNASMNEAVVPAAGLAALVEWVARP